MLSNPPCSSRMFSVCYKCANPSASQRLTARYKRLLGWWTQSRTCLHAIFVISVKK